MRHQSQLFQIVCSSKQIISSLTISQGYYSFLQSLLPPGNAHASTNCHGSSGQTPMVTNISSPLLTLYPVYSQVDFVPSRDTSSLITPPHTSTPPPPSLPSHLTLSIPPKPALYGSPTMQPADYRSLVQSRLLSMTAAHLVWGCVRLIRECLHVNKAVVGKVCGVCV